MVGRKLSSREQHLLQSVSVHQRYCSMLVTQGQTVDSEVNADPHALLETTQEPALKFTRSHVWYYGLNILTNLTGQLVNSIRKKQRANLK